MFLIVVLNNRKLFTVFKIVIYFLLSFDTQRTKDLLMISIKTTRIPLDFDVSLRDFFTNFLAHNRQTRSDQITYEYQQRLIIKENVGVSLLPSTLIFYPELCKNLRKFKQLDYQVSLELDKNDTFNMDGLRSIIETLIWIEQSLYEARSDKSQLDAKVNNLIYLYGQERQTPIINSIKPYYYQRGKCNSLRRVAYIINISGVPYYLNYHGKKFGAINQLFSIKSRDLLADYFNATKQDSSAVKPVSLIDCVGGVQRTPMLLFRVRDSYRHRGRRFFINLADNATYTRINDARIASLRYTTDFILNQIKD